VSLYDDFMSGSHQKYMTLIAIMLFSLAFSKGLINIFLNPPFQAADEPMHLEAALVTGNMFPHIFSLDECRHTEFQKPILTVMSNHFFYSRVTVPEPIPLPDRFRRVPFIRDAPSKIGRQPFFYILTGLPAHLFTDGILEALYLTRSINLLLACLALGLFYLITRIVFKQDRYAQLFALSCFVLHPAFWHLGSSMTPESIKVILICAGLLLSITICRKGLTIWNTLLATAWLLLVAASAWTLVPPALMIVCVTLFSVLQEKNRCNGLTRTYIPAVLAVGSALVVLTVSNTTLLIHELSHVTTGIQNLARGHVSLFPLIKNLHISFWAGFNWLTVPLPKTAPFIFACISFAWFSAFFYYLIISCVKKDRSTLHKTIILTTILWVFLIVIRASADEPAAQGRYLFPVLPLIIIGVSTGLRLIRHSKLRFCVFILIIGLNTYGDISANLGGWIVHQHVNYARLKEPVRSLSSFSWLESGGTFHILDFRHPHASAFLSEGWYPPEQGCSHRWMLNRSVIALPMLYAQDSLLHLDISPFSIPGHNTRELLVEFNGCLLGSRRVQPGWHTYTFGIQKDLFEPGMNWLVLTCTEAFSPKDLNLSNDSRILSIALKGLELEPLSGSVSILREGSGWFFTPDSTPVLRFTPGDTIRVIRCEPEDHFHTVYSDGHRERIWLITGQELQIDTIREIQSITLRQAGNNRAVELFSFFETSVQHLPGILSDAYLHFLLIALWITLSIAVFIFFLGLFLYMAGA
jgi:hypothetical protein